MTLELLRQLAAACMVAACAAAMAPATPAADPAPRPARGSGPRLWAAAAPSFQLGEGAGGGTTGYALGGGVEFGHVVALTLEAGYQYAPTGREPYLVNSLVPGPPVLRVEPARGRSLLSGTVGVRAAFTRPTWEPFVDLGLGVGSRRDPGYRIVDPVTGAVIVPSRPEWASALIAEGGAGVRTRRRSGCDFLLAFRSRWATVEGEGGFGRWLQLRVGILTP